jgi:predicted dienelactone hydrolase
MRILFIGLAVAGCTAKQTEDSGGVASEAVDPLDWPVDEAGPYAVGYRSWDVTYSPGDGFADRSIRLNLWYPTEDTSGDAALYTIGTDGDSFADARPIEPVHPGGFPVHVHSHGYRGYGASSSFLSRYLATHGWVTAAPDHTNNTFVDHEEPLPAAHYFHRPLDVRATLDALDALPSDDALSGKMVTDQVLLSGHSFGAYTTWSTLGASFDLDSIGGLCAAEGELNCTADEEAMFSTDLADPRVVASFPLAGTLRREFFGDQGETTVNGPVLFMSGSNDAVGQAEQFEQMGPIDFTWMEIEGACHQSFALGVCTDLDRDLGFQIISTVGLAWARVTVLGDHNDRVNGIVQGDVQVSDLVSTERKQSTN